MNADEPLGLPPELFGAAFPFHFAVDRQLTLRSIGDSLLRLCPSLTVGAPLADFVTIQRPEFLSDFESIRQADRQVFILAICNQPTRLRGQMIYLAGQEWLVFLGSPWLTSPGEIKALGLTLSDFAIHDPVVDLLQVVQNQTLVLTDMRKLADRLARQRADLRDANAALRREVDERLLIEADLREREQRLEAMLTSASEAIVVVDAFGRISEVNPRAEVLFGYERQEIIGQSVEKLLPDSVRNRHTAHRAGFMEAPRMRPMGGGQVLTGRRRDGAALQLEIGLSPIKSQNTTLVMAFISDVSERVRAAEALRESAESIRSLYDIIAAQHLGSWEKIGALLEMGCQRFGMRIGILSHIQDERYEVIAARSPDNVIPPGAVFDLGQTYCRDTLAADQPIGFEHAAASAWASHPCYAAFKLEAYLGTPVMVAGQVYGTLNFSDPRPKPTPFRPMDREFVRLMAQWIGSEIERLDRTRQLEAFAAEIAQKNRELAEARDQALEASRLKSEFLATMSHEIRTPMNSILGIAELFQDTPLDEEQKEYAGLVQESGQALLTIINDILDFSKIEAGRLILEHTDFNPAAVVEGAADLLAAAAAMKKVALMTFVSPDIPRQLKGDPGRLRQALLNLLSNAVKFTARGEIVARAELEEASETHVKVRFAVTDTGIGLSAADQARLFQPFTQADGSTTRRYGGTGLGLAITKRLAQLLGGEIGVDSEPGKGATFWFTARFERAAGANAGQASGDAQGQNLRGVHALIVDANASRREIAQRYLAAAGLRAETAASGEDALDCLRATEAGPIDVVITDLTLPAMDGFSLRRAMRRNARWAGIPTILLTEFDEREEGEQAIEAGFAAYLTKPLKQTQLLDAVGRAYASSEASATARTGAMRGAPRPANRQYQPTSDLQAEPPAAAATILLVEDNTANQLTASLQINRLGYAIDIVSNGAEAIARLSGAHPYAAVLMDVQMPELDGFTATREIRKAEVALGRHVPIIAMTANALEGDREKCLAAGMDDYISKPVQLSKLAAILEHWTQAQSDPTGV
jgi:PAS domain S-box-containing protein